MPAAPSSRRDFLLLAAVAPLAAGCATLGAGPPVAPAAGPSIAAVDPLARLRAVPLPPSVEPALVFRVLGGRGRCG